MLATPFTVLAKRRYLLCLLTAVTSLIGGCGPMAQKPMPAETQMDRLAEELATPAAERSVPSAVSDALLGGSPRAAQPAPEQERFDVSVKSAPAKTFFLSLMEGTDFNIVVHPDLTGSISLDLKNVTIEDVLGVIREIYGYEFKYKNGIYTIYPRELHTEIFHIDYLDVKRVGISDTSVNVGKLESGGRNNDRSNRNYSQDDSGLLDLLIDRGEEGQRSRSRSSRGSTSGARVQTVSHTDFWSSLQQTIEVMIGGFDEGRKVVVTPQAGMVIVKALPNELSNVRDFLERSELSVKRQVLLEAKIIEVRLSDEFNAGINWNTIGGQLAYSRNVSAFDNQGGITLDDTVSGVFGTVLTVPNINDLLDLLGTQGSVQVLSNQRLSTVNNQKAVFRAGTDEYFVTDFSSDTTTSSAAVVVTPDIEFTSFFSGIALDVTPQISDNGEIILHIHPVITDVQDQAKILKLGDQTFEFPLALRDIRESDSIVRAQSGEVVVLGGLMQEIEEFEYRRYAGIGDIPLIGGLFRGKTAVTLKTELVILLKPTIVDSEVTKNEIKSIHDRIKALGDEQRRLLKND